MLRTCLFIAAVAAAVTAATPEDAALRHARELLRTVILIDGHNDLPWAIHERKSAPGDVDALDLSKRTEGDTDIPRLRAGGVGAQFWSVYVPGESKNGRFAALQLEQIELTRRMIAKYPDDFALCLSAADVVRAHANGKIGSLVGMEGGHALEDSLGALRAYYDLGVRYMTLTHNVSLAWADAAAGVPRNGGLSDFGRKVVREMNRLGMMVDLSHTSPKVMADAMDVSEAPVIFSHSCARALADQARNVPDDILKRLPDQGGVVMVTFVPLFVSGEVAAWWAPVWPQVLADPTQSNLERVKAQHIKDAGPEPKATLAQVADQIDYVRKVAGVDHVGIGGDFPATAGAPVGLEDVSKYPDLFAELIRRGWTDADLEKLAGGNVLRVMRRAEEVAVRAATSRRPSLARMTAAGASAPPSILGVWRGQSTCIKDGVHPACKDETVIYTFRPVAGREDAVVLDAEKLVDGVPSLMGALDLAYDRERAEWAVELETPNMHARWAFVVHGDEILGTLTDLPSGHLTRHAFARKSP